MTDKYLRELERSGFDEFQILQRLMEKSERPNDLITWAKFLEARKQPQKSPHSPHVMQLAIKDRSDEEIIELLTGYLSRDITNIDPRNWSLTANEALLRGLAVYASVECCSQKDCSLCNGRGKIYSNKRLFPLDERRVYNAELGRSW